MPYNRWIEGWPMNIYKLINPLNEQVFYVGRTQRKLSYRILGHLSAGRGNQRGTFNKRHSELIGGILKAGQAPVIELVDQVAEINSEDDFSFACYLEKFWILRHLEIGYQLTNRQPSYTINEIETELNKYNNMEAKTRISVEVLHGLCRAFDMINADRWQNIFVDPQTLESIKDLFVGANTLTFKLQTDKSDKNSIRIDMDGFTIIFKTL